MRYLSSLKVGCLALILTVGSSAAHAAEVSLATGLFKTEKDKKDGDTIGTKSTVEVGGRYADALSDRTHWYAKVDLTLHSYTGSDSPDNSTGFELLGGLRQYFPGFSTSVTPYLGIGGGYRAAKDASGDTGGWVVSEKNGLYYQGFAGFRFTLDKDFFIDLEAQLFDSALFATEKTEIKGGMKTQATKSELFATSYGGAHSVTIGVGMKL